MKLFDFAWFKDYPLVLQELADLAMTESWNYKSDQNTNSNPILQNFLFHTFQKLYAENKIKILGDFCVFNVGLVTNNQEEIYAYFNKNRFPNAKSAWFFYGWRKKSDRDLTKFGSLPECAYYFKDPSDLIYDNNIELRINIDHIILDNRERFPSAIRILSDHLVKNILSGTIEDAKQRVRRNYKTAIPQFYKGEIQLLLPLCLSSSNCADLALVIEKDSNTYRASTCLTLDMAINNARLIAKPDDEWLKF